MSSELRSAMNDEAKRLMVDSTYSGRGHHEAGRSWACWHLWLGLPAAITSALLASGAGASAVLGGKPLLTAGLAVASAILTALHGFLHPGELADQHSLKGDRYIAIRNAARLFREIDLRLASTDEELAPRLKELREKYAAVTESPPRRIPRRAYSAAKKGIEAGEATYDNDPLWKELK